MARKIPMNPQITVERMRKPLESERAFYELGVCVGVAMRHYGHEDILDQCSIAEQLYFMFKGYA